MVWLKCSADASEHGGIGDVGVGVAEHSEENRMTVENLASVFAPNILRQADYDPDVEMSVTPVITLTIAGFIRCHEELFRYELTHFAQLRCAALASTAAGATEAGAAAAPVVVQHQTRQNFSEPPPESVPALTTSVHCSAMMGQVKARFGISITASGMYVLHFLRWIELTTAVIGAHKIAALG
ncbi:rho gtpase activating protein [Echinococcus granulosus]|uniref:Rho gtpase activating protein n=1 Tax=Echinococcus granulosus TaxID=6210 RepID=W6VBA6_ECHGR|nr:rho gtpase activating protein [Echinococcus granulosus]EUB64079.1 rho gtpase activating protein [Echinococcus granulosus]